MKTLVIHPEDETTNFLKDIYIDKDFDVIQNKTYPKCRLNYKIKKYDRVILLGHGMPTGLIGGYGMIIDQENVEALQGRSIIGIWCYAKQFIKANNLRAFATNMFISEKHEADLLGIRATEHQIAYSNRLFAIAVRENLHLPMHLMQREVLGIYRCRYNPVIRYNYRQMILPVE